MSPPAVPVGAHVPVAGSLATGGLRHTDDVGAQAVQVLVGNPRGWRRSAGDPAQDAVSVAGLAERGVVVHAGSAVDEDRYDAALRERLLPVLDGRPGVGVCLDTCSAERLAYPSTAGVPVVVETPSAERGHARDLALLCALRDGAEVPSAA